MDDRLNQWILLHKDQKYFAYLTKDLANYLGVSPRTIQRWVKEKNNPSEYQLAKIKQYLDDKKNA